MKFSSVEDLIKNQEFIRQKIFDRMVDESLTYKYISQEIGLHQNQVAKFVAGKGDGVDGKNHCRVKSLIKFARWAGLMDEAKTCTCEKGNAHGQDKDIS